MTRIGRHVRATVAASGAVAGVLVLCVSVGPGSAHAAFPGANGPIAFNSNRDVGAGEIYAITPGGATTRLTNSTTSSDPAYSPDGTKIAFVSADPGGIYQIFVMNADGSGRRQITTSATAKQDPTWAPDGNQIAYAANSFDVDGQTDLEIWAVNADGSGARQITSNTFPDTYPAWSPLGDRIAFVSARTGDTNRNIYVMNADGTGQTSITANSPTGCAPSCYQGHDDDPAWSPDGTKIAFVHGEDISGGGLPNIWTMAPDGSGKTNVTNSATVSFTQPAWSPQGNQLAAVGAADTNRDIWTMNADGTGQAPVAAHPAHDINPDWGPAPPPDTTPPGLDLSGKATRDLGETVKVKAACDEVCELDAAGKVAVSGTEKARVSLKGDSASLAPGEKATLKLKLSKKKLKKIERALESPRTKAKAKIKVVAVDPAGNESAQKWAVKLRE